MPDVGLLTPGVCDAPGVHRTDDVAVVRALLSTEVAWVRAQARCGVATTDAVETVTRAAATLAADDADAARLAAEVAAGSGAGGNPIIPLLSRLRAATGPESAAIHADLTSQDVLDTALVLVVRAAAQDTVRDLSRVRAALARHAREYRATPVTGRTLTQAAVPTTVGARIAGWLQEVAESEARLRAEIPRLPLSYGGAAGTLALRLDADPFALVDAWADELDLTVTAGPWHVTRFPVERVAAALAGVSTSLGVVAGDVLTGARPEIAELREPSAPGRGASSTMAHKRNPVLSVLLRRSALVVPQLLAQVVTAAGFAVDERPDGAWHAEWPALRDLARYAASSARTGAELAEGLEVDVEAAARNLRANLGVDPATADVGAAPAIVDRVIARYATVPVEEP